MGSRSLQVPLDDPERAAETILAHDAVAPLDAVVAIDDGGAVAAALASQRLGLRHNPPDAVAATRDKLVMRMRLGAGEVAQPPFTALPGDAGPEEARLVGTIGLPCVIKPTTLSASQGVLRADTTEQAIAVVDRVRAIVACATGDTDAPLLIEGFVSGPEVAVEGLLTDGELSVLAVFDKPDPLDGPAFEETIYVTPSRLSDADMEAVTVAASSACRALGLVQGPVHAEIRVSEGRATIIEVAARTIGGLCARALSFSTGRSLEQLVIAQALGWTTGPARRRARASGVLMVPIPRAGILVGVDGQDRGLAVPGVTDVEITIAPGHPVAPVPEGNRYLGFVFARDATPARVEAVAAAGLDAVSTSASHQRPKHSRRPHRPDRRAATHPVPTRPRSPSPRSPSPRWCGPLPWGGARRVGLDLRTRPSTAARGITGPGVAARRPRRALRRPVAGPFRCRASVVGRRGGLLGPHAHRHAPGLDRLPADSVPTSRYSGLSLRPVRRARCRARRDGDGPPGRYDHRRRVRTLAWWHGSTPSPPDPRRGSPTTGVRASPAPSSSWGGVDSGFRPVTCCPRSTAMPVWLCRASSAWPATSKPVTGAPTGAVIVPSPWSTTVGPGWWPRMPWWPTWPSSSGSVPGTSPSEIRTS